MELNDTIKFIEQFRDEQYPHLSRSRQYEAERAALDALILALKARLP